MSVCFLFARKRDVDFFAFGKLKHCFILYFYLSHAFGFSSSSPVLNKNFRNVLRPIYGQFHVHKTLNWKTSWVIFKSLCFEYINNESFFFFIVFAIIKTGSGLFHQHTLRYQSLPSGITLEIKLPRHTLSQATFAAKKHRGWGWGAGGGNRDKQRKCQGHRCQNVCLVKWPSDKMRGKTESDDETDSEMSLNHPRGHLLLCSPVIL